MAKEEIVLALHALSGGRTGWVVFSGLLEDAQIYTQDFFRLAVVERRPTDDELRTINQTPLPELADVCLKTLMPPLGLKLLLKSVRYGGDQWETIDLSTL